MTPALIIGFVVLSLAVTAFARSRGLAAPLLLVVVGVFASFIPAVPHIELSHEVILGVVLPPLLYSAALSSSYQDLRTSLHAITRLGVGAVVVTALAVAGLVTWLFPAIGFLPALVLGAVVAPPDAVAAVAVGKKLGLPRKVMTILTGESLINDATSLTLYKVALAGVASGVWSLTTGFETFLLAVIVGVGIGLILGSIANRVRLALDDTTVAILVSVLVPFICYWSAEELNGSGVLAVVAAGLYLGKHAPEASYTTRLREAPIWESVDLALETITFAIIGLQLRWIVADVLASNQGLGHAIAVSAVVLGVVIVIRPAYVFATSKVDSFRLPGSPRPANDTLSWRESLVVGWAGMRGVVTIAAAAAIPVMTGAIEFPERATVQLAALTTAIGTLLLQGLTLPWLIKRLHLNGDEDHRLDSVQEMHVRVLMAEAQAAVISTAINRWSGRLGKDQASEIADKLRARIVAAGAAASQVARDAQSVTDLSQQADSRPGDWVPIVPPAANEQAAPPAAGAKRAAGAGNTQLKAVRQRSAMIQQVRRDLIKAQRQVLATERDRGSINETVMRSMLREIDLAEESLSTSWLSRMTP
ncbi:cation:proton antiporter [Rarobacter incanus]|uniref:Sodium/proton antiporter (CPA1 family) n=1 Tax=Rarobacter incanus TaxID=153494 RepID=A0A542SRD3_9MICO|nr:sodium:proton antiporter [Rarobacter incanus]TQK77172.1 sodium/proton antiporter (CPA1 family) [Rarobacter incanus]